MLPKKTSPAAKSGSNISSSGTNWPKLISFWPPRTPALGSLIRLKMTCDIPSATPKYNVIISPRNESMISLIIWTPIPIPASAAFLDFTAS